MRGPLLTPFSQSVLSSQLRLAAGESAVLLSGSGFCHSRGLPLCWLLEGVLFISSGLRVFVHLSMACILVACVLNAVAGAPDVVGVLNVVAFY